MRYLQAIIIGVFILLRLPVTGQSFPFLYFQDFSLIKPYHNEGNKNIKEEWRYLKLPSGKDSLVSFTAFNTDGQITYRKYNVNFIVKRDREYWKPEDDYFPNEMFFTYEKHDTNRTVTILSLYKNALENKVDTLTEKQYWRGTSMESITRNAFQDTIALKSCGYNIRNQPVYCLIRYKTPFFSNTSPVKNQKIFKGDSINFKYTPKGKLVKITSKYFGSNAAGENVDWNGIYYNAGTAIFYKKKTFSKTLKEYYYAYFRYPPHSVYPSPGLNRYVIIRGYKPVKNNTLKESFFLSGKEFQSSLYNYFSFETPFMLENWEINGYRKFTYYN